MSPYFFKSLLIFKLMKNKKEVVLDSGNDLSFDQDDSFRIGASTIILFSILLIISLAFFILLNSKNSTGFGLSEIIKSIIFALASALFYRWAKLLMDKNKYMGIIIGILGMASSVYSILLRFRGVYTTTLTALASITILIYLVYHFWRS